MSDARINGGGGIPGQVPIDDPGDARPRGPRWCLWCDSPACRIVEVEPGRRRKDKRTGVYEMTSVVTAPVCDACFRRIERRKERAA